MTKKLFIIRFAAAAALVAAPIIMVTRAQSARAIVSMQGKADSKDALYHPFTYEVNPEDFSIRLTSGGNEYDASGPQPGKKPESVEMTTTKRSWSYPEERIAVSAEHKGPYLSVTIRSDAKAENSFQFPSVSGDEYYLPLGEGKRIPADDEIWSEYLTTMDFSMAEQLSMPFFAAAVGDKAMVYVAEQPYRSRLHFSGDAPLRFEVVNGFSSLQEIREITYRIYLTDNDPVSIAKLYKDYVQERGRFKTLREKEESNENVSKLYGAPHIYLWNSRVITPDDIHWNAFKEQANSEIMAGLIEQSAGSESHSEFKTVMNSLAKQEYIDSYQKNVISSALSELLRKEDFLLRKDVGSLTPPEWIERNKKALSDSLPGVFAPVSTWADSATTVILDDMKASGIENAWIGLDNWETAYAKPSLIEKAEHAGYLIATYDSYHSIHEPGKEEWNTAAFSDPDLYETGTISDMEGRKVGGFKNVGRKLNPALSFEEVEQRVNTILKNGMALNSWFIDCDATGEIYDDYSPAHPTAKEEDLAARLKRIAYIRDEKGMVVGSEGGNDFAAGAIAFAHGIELPTFSWMDDDMKDKDSEYYIGAYYSRTGGVPDHFGRQIRVKDRFKHIFLDVRYDVPLYKLVYNDSLITSYHWDWSTLKIEGETANRMLREILYNVPPLYHLDAEAWRQWKSVITEHTNRWSAFSQKAIRAEMTNFRYLDEAGYVQKTEFGSGLFAIANYSDREFIHEGSGIPPHSALIGMDGDVTIYTPKTD